MKNLDNKKNGGWQNRLERFVISIFTVIYRKYLKDQFTGKYSKIVEIKGWRTILIDTPVGQRIRITPLFKLYRKYL